MSTPTKKEWQVLTMSAFDRLDHVETILGETLVDIQSDIDKLKNIIDWSWEWYSRDGNPVAVYWDNATDKEIKMLDYAAKFNHIWPEASKKVDQARQLLQEAYHSLYDLRKED